MDVICGWPLSCNTQILPPRLRACAQRGERGVITSPLLLLHVSGILSAALHPRIRPRENENELLRYDELNFPDVDKGGKKR